MITVAVRNKDGSKALFRCEACPYEVAVAAVKAASPRSCGYTGFS